MSNMSASALANFVCRDVATSEAVLDQSLKSWRDGKRYLGKCVLVIRKMKSIWQRMGSGQEGKPKGSNSKEMLLSSDITDISDEGMKRVWVKIIDRKWRDRLIMTYGKPKD